MLQPRQLQSLEARYGAAIAALRHFLVAAELPLHSQETLSLLSRRIASDRAFRRDLRSTLWLTAHPGNGSVPPAELAGMLALAAAGAPLAAAAGDDEAHQLLVMAMEASALGQPPKSTAHIRRGSSRWPLAACLLLAALTLPLLYVRYGLAHRTERSSTASPAVAHEGARAARTPDEEPAYAEPAPQPSLQAEHNASSAMAARARTPWPRPSAPVRPGLVRPPAMTAFATSKGTGTAAIPPPPAQPSASPSGPPANVGVAAPTASTGLAVQRTTHLNLPIASAVLSQRLDARTLPPEYASDPPRSYPRLLRRHPLAPASEASDATSLFAANEGPVVNVAGANAAHGSPGTVRPVSLGTMAANVLYSPAPAYPPAAAAAHVQGQVTVQAEVDRDGNVAAARVVSGPPLLRDAAVDAVQRWRYRPYRSAGKPVSASATAVVDFELP